MKKTIKRKIISMIDRYDNQKEHDLDFTIEWKNEAYELLHKILLADEKDKKLEINKICVDINHALIDGKIVFDRENMQNEFEIATDKAEKIINKGYGQR